MKIKTTNYKNKPISAEVAIYSVDKALFELINVSKRDIFENFWRQRYDGTSNANSLMGIWGDLAEKGGGGGDERTAFKDLAYWNPNVKTDKDGYAEVSFKIPDYLTTWVISGVGVTKDTVVGQTTNEIKSSKDIAIRPVLPNIIRVSDEAVIEASVNNFTDSDREIIVRMDFNAGVVDAQEKKIELKSNETKSVFWKVYPDTENENSEMKFSLLGDSPENSDVVIKNIQIQMSEFFEPNANFRNGETSYEIELSPNSDKSKTEIRMLLASTLLNKLPSAMRYLTQYPYGCVEQTTSRFVPVVISKENEELFADSLKDKKLDDMMEVGIKKLKDMQGDDGGWGWWGDNSDYFVSGYVAEYLIRAKKVVADVDQGVLDKAKNNSERAVGES